MKCLLGCSRPQVHPPQQVLEARVVAEGWDLAVATWSVTWNLGPGWEDLFLETYGIDADTERIRYFRLLYDLAS